MTYASQVKDVLIPYTTREDTYTYYEERNYVSSLHRNDANQIALLEVKKVREQGSQTQMEDKLE